MSVFLDEAERLEAKRLDALSPPDRAQARRLVLAALRGLPSIDAALARRLRDPLPDDAYPIVDILRILAAELLRLDAPAHAAVSEAVTLARAAKPRFANLVNAVGRRLAEEAVAGAPAEPAGKNDTPPSFWARMTADWGETLAERIALGHLAGAPLDLSLRDPASATAWADRLGAQITPTGGLRAAIKGPVASAEGYEDGAWWVQDAASALPARLVDARPGERVLDLCAAPGGKTLQLAAAGATVTALDLDNRRLQRVRENLERARLSAEIVAADALTWSPRGDESFDAVLLDAPCSASGTVRRHPELPHIKNLSDIAPLLAKQDALLDAAWARVRPGGRLVYCVCSIVRAEGEDRADAALSRWPDVEVSSIAPLLPVGEAGGDAALWEDGAPEGWRAELDRGRLRTLPSQWRAIGGLDGFFAARIVKRG